MHAFPWWMQSIVSTYQFGTTAVTAALLVYLLPLQVLELVGEEWKGRVLGLVIFSGAFSNMLLPMFGEISDHTVTYAGKRIPYIVVGVIIQAVGLLGLAWFGSLTVIFPLFLLSYVLYSFGCALATGPYGALIPDMCGPGQRGSLSGFIGLGQMLGTLYGAAIVGLSLALLRAYFPEHVSIEITYISLILILVATCILTAAGMCRVFFVQRVHERHHLHHLHHGYHEHKDDLPDEEEGVSEKMDREQSSDTIASDAVFLAAAGYQNGETILLSKVNAISSTDSLPTCNDNDNGTDKSKDRLLPASVGATEGEEEEAAAAEAVQNGDEENAMAVEHGKEDIHASHSLIPLTCFAVHCHAPLGKNWFVHYLGGVFSPFRRLNFCLVYITRFLMVCGFYTCEEYMLFYVRDRCGAGSGYGIVSPYVDDTSAASLMFLILLCSAAVGAFASGKVSDMVGKKNRRGRIAVVFVSGAGLSICAIIFGVVDKYELILLISIVFGLCYGAFESVDYALAADVLENPEDVARDMSIWMTSMYFPIVIASPTSGVLLDYFNEFGVAYLNYSTFGYVVIFFVSATYFALSSLFVLFVRIKYDPDAPIVDSSDSESDGEGEGAGETVTVEVH